MKLTQLHIQNFRSCRDISLEIGSIHALVGANNAGKSTVLRALDFLFNPSAKSLNEESFWNKDTTQEIRVEAVFSDLTKEEKGALNPYLKPDGTFHIARSAKMGTRGGESDEEQADDKIKISQHYKKAIPEQKWLQEDNINNENIKEWWKNNSQLTVAGVSFADSFNGASAPTISDWKEKAKAFVVTHADKISMQDTWVENPRGFANALKETLPFFILIPAVRDVTEESKGTKSTPFGKLLHAILDTISAEKKSEIEGILGDVAKQMNRSGGDARIQLISGMEDRLKELLNELFTGCDLEIEFETPTLESLLNAPRLYVDDGFRNAVENKGHGLQRSVIFTILRCYAEYMTSEQEDKKRSLILAVEEPELYMHPQAQRTIRQVFREIAEGGDQVIFSTHSPLLVDVAYFDEIIRMEIARELVKGDRTTQSTAWQLPMAKMICDFKARFPDHKGSVTAESIRELYSHAYNPHRNEGFFASKIILVEGLTEEYSLPIYADALPDCAFDPQGISVVECGGKGWMDRLFRIFNELHIPCYVLFDYDDENGDAKSIAKSKELLTLAGKSPDAPNSLFVDDSIACFPTKWESHLRQEISDMDTLAEEAREKLGLDGGSGKPLIARYIARKITSRDPPSVPPSLKAIIEKAVVVSWKGSCLKTQSDGG